MLRDSDFRQVLLADRDLFSRHYERYPQVHSDNSFTNMVCWNHYAHYRYAHSNGSIVLSSTIGGRTRYRPPIGPRNEELLAEVMELAARSDDPFPLVVLDPGSREWIAGIYPELDMRPERSYFDYVYLASDLADLPGRRYLTIRHQLNKFQRTCSPVVEAIDEGNIWEIQEFLDLWCDWKDCDSDPLLAGERDAVSFAIAHYQELGLSGIAIRANGRIGAISIFEGLNRETALVHFEKGLPDCKGIYRAINAEAARILARRFTYINRESDMGVEGIREAKMRYHPHHVVEVHLIEREDIEGLI
ncbi:MAG: phosphatidylglycerol lysyltransferase domain-containing protein [Methanothrix sp.]|nr:phosphatidylglycerol lysyltransferase domain-containing protein [Methanothrix sp.]